MDRVSPHFVPSSLVQLALCLMRYSFISIFLSQELCIYTVKGIIFHNLVSQC